ncbi:hypothetical protein ACIBF1_12605 [Spirillospora sp. NPDC050679]
MPGRRRPIAPLALFLCLAALFGLVYDPGPAVPGAAGHALWTPAAAGGAPDAFDTPCDDAGAEPAFIANHAQASSPSPDQPGTIAALPGTADMALPPPGRAPPPADPGVPPGRAPPGGAGARAPPTSQGS